MAAAATACQARLGCRPKGLFFGDCSQCTCCEFRVQLSKQNKVAKHKSGGALFF